LVALSRLARLLVPLLLLAPTALVVPTASAEPRTFTLVAGGFSDETSAVTVNDFNPSEVTVNVGDTVTWKVLGFHNVLFPGPETPPPLIVADPDNPERQIFNPAVAFPTDGDTFDGTALRNSGLPSDEGDQSAGPPTYSLTFTAPGTFAYFCSVHPGMTGRVVVQADGELPATPEDVEAAAQQKVNDLIGEVVMKEATTPPTGEPRVLAGVVASNAEAESLHFAPGTLTVPVGQPVTWTMDANSRELHTVTFLSGGPEVSLESVEEHPGGPPTIVVNPQAAAAAGGTSYDGSGYVNSGFFAAGQSYSLTFTAPGTYSYYCIIHGPMMSGTITVTAEAPPSGAGAGTAAPNVPVPAPQVPS